MHRYNWPKTSKASIFPSRSLIMTELRKRKHATRRLSHTPSQEGSGWLQKWFFSQTSGSSWLSLYPGSHWKDTVEPMDRSLFDRAPLTGIPGSMQEYVSSVTTAGMSKYRELPEQVLSNQRHQILFWCRTTLWKPHSGDLYRPVFSLQAHINSIQDTVVTSYYCSNYNLLNFYCLLAQLKNNMQKNRVLQRYIKATQPSFHRKWQL